MGKKKTKSKKKPLGFEQSLGELEQVVNDLEQGKLSLAESLVKYESGMAHLRNCYEALKKAEKQIHVLVAVDEAGNAKVADFDHQATHEQSEEPETDEEDFSDEDPNDGSLF
jgi:exodeoxyribonuclease VII small subunit